MPDALQNFIDVASKLGGVLMLLFYASLVLWTYKDARRRIEDPILVASSVAISMLPLVGVLVYMLLRPPEYLADVRERELEIRAMERALSGDERCPHCRSHIESDYLACPICMSKLRQPCGTCDRPLDPRWQMCPFCETEVPRARRERRDSERRPARAPRPTSRPAAEPTRRAAAKPAAPAKVERPVETERPARPAGTEDIHTEPFSSAREPRFVRSESPVDPVSVVTAPRIETTSMDQSTLIPTTPPRLDR